MSPPINQGIDRRFTSSVPTESSHECPRETWFHIPDEVFEVGSVIVVRGGLPST
jgi:hypothetical protein